jgi:ribonucleotide reductase alpha subunit
MIQTIHDYGVKFLGVKGKTVADVTVDEHVAVATTAQKYVDQAVSKTSHFVIFFN